MANSGGPYNLRVVFLPKTHGVSIKSLKPAEWSEWMCVKKANSIFSTSSSGNSPPQDGDNEEALLTTPGPKSIRYAWPLVMTAYAEPVRSGSGLGVPDPRIINFVSEYVDKEIKERSNSKERVIILKNR